VVKDLLRETKAVYSFKTGALCTRILIEYYMEPLLEGEKEICGF